jgi:hypothetical protein
MPNVTESSSPAITGVGTRRVFSFSAYSTDTMLPSMTNSPFCLRFIWQQLQKGAAVAGTSPTSDDRELPRSVVLGGVLSLHDFKSKPLLGHQIRVHRDSETGKLMPFILDEEGRNSSRIQEGRRLLASGSECRARRRPCCHRVSAAGDLQEVPLVTRGPVVVCVSAACQSREGRWHSCLLRAVKRS